MGYYAPPLSLLGTQTTLFTLSADMNSTSDQVFVPAFVFSKYVIDRIVVTDATVSMTNAKGGVYAQASKAGEPIVPASQAYSGLAGAQDQINPTMYLNGQKVMTATPILSLTTAQGIPALATWVIMGVAG